MVTEFELLMLTLTVIALIMASIAAIYSIWVKSKYDRKEIQIDKRGRRIEGSLASFEGSALKMVDMLDSVVSMLAAHDPKALTDAMLKLDEMKTYLADELPTAMMKKSRRSLAELSKKEIKNQKAMAALIDEGISEKLMAGFDATNPSAVQQQIVGMIMDYPELKPFAESYIQSRMGNAQIPGAAPAAAAGSHAMD